MRRAVSYEVARGGQVFYVHNRIESIRRVAEALRRALPDVSIGVAHGRMEEDALERAMLEFADGYHGVLVCTTIIESGLDLPNVNTLVVDRVDRLGLAQLYQIRGRVGRAGRRAYAYLFYPHRAALTDTAVTRLAAISEMTQLGSGTKVAMRDLEIRGAGNILGAEQSGHITAVGYEMYCQLLEVAVKRAKGEKVEEVRRADVQLELAAFIPNAYVPTETQRIALYRQLRRAATAQRLAEVAAEVADMYGPLPEEVRRLVDLEEVRVAGGRAGLGSTHRKGADLTITLEDMAVLGPLFSASADRELRDAGIVRVLDPHTVVWRLHEDRGAAGALALLKKALAPFSAKK